MNSWKYFTKEVMVYFMEKNLKEQSTFNEKWIDFIKFLDSVSNKYLTAR
jgi:hypothetical protein